MQTFSDAKFFNTVFIGGDDMVAEELADKKREVEEWKKKVVVENEHFFVNTKPNETHQKDKYHSMRQDPIVKIGLRLGAEKMKHLSERQIKATKGTPNAPIAMFAQEEWKMNETAPKPLKQLIPDFGKTPVSKDGKPLEKNFSLYSRHGISEKRALSNKVFIEPLREAEKTGLKWHPQKV